jgi:3-hydroxyisobutyrate dehydrogenase-like beta-hydroxyacid dehydrogenase
MAKFDRTDVSILGTGAMGSAFAKAFLKAGKRVTVWNRTAERAKPLAEEGAQLTYDATDAICASPVTIAIFLDHDAVLGTLTDHRLAHSRDRTLVNLTTASEAGHRALAERTRRAGGLYLGGGIISYPRNIGKEHTAIVYGGDPQAFDKHEPLLQLLAGGQQFIGPDPASGVHVYSALAAIVVQTMTAFLEGAAWGDKNGIPAARMFELALAIGFPFLDEAIKDQARRIASNDLEGSEASIDTFVSAFEANLAAKKAAGIGTKMLEATKAYAESAQAQGFGSRDFAAIYTVIRHTSNPATKT